jgi:hypothetical protein
MPLKCLGFKTPLRFLPNAAVSHLPVESGMNGFDESEFFASVMTELELFSKTGITLDEESAIAAFFRDGAYNL